MEDPIDRLRRECELYRRLLQLGTRREVEPFLAEALALVLELTEARRGYIELFGGAVDAREPAWWIAQGCAAADIDGIRQMISRGIVAEAVATGRTVVTSSALLDPRFGSRASVKGALIESVLCAPIGADPPIGVTYLEGCPTGWSDDARALAELFAQHVAPLADLLLAHRRAGSAADTSRIPESFRLEGIVGQSTALMRALEQAALVAPLDVNVLLTGESGTGKSQLAWTIHRNSRRAGGPFVELNCAALPETLVENELFGAREGAHSTARRGQLGKVAAAEGGTLFLDEIGELPRSSQAKLLQLLQSKQYFPLGAAVPMRADVRVIAATNRDLSRAVAEKQFREDLYYRLEVLPIRMPTLAERMQDIPDLARHFVAQACERHGLAVMAPSARALRALEAAEWPGNLRQLAHALEAAVIRAAGEQAARVESHHVFPALDGDDTDDAPDALTFQEATRRFQRTLVRRTLEETGWNVTEAARRLDLARSHLYNLIGAFRLDRER